MVIIMTVAVIIVVAILKQHAISYCHKQTLFPLVNWLIDEAVTKTKTALRNGSTSQETLNGLVGNTTIHFAQHIDMI
jgi:hypothetical protein